MDEPGDVVFWETLKLLAEVLDLFIYLGRVQRSH